MVVVAYGPNRVQPQTGTGRIQTRATPDQFGSQIGEAASQAGSAVAAESARASRQQQIAAQSEARAAGQVFNASMDIGDRRQARQDEIRINDAEKRIRLWNDERHAKGGLFTLKGYDTQGLDKRIERDLDDLEDGFELGEGATSRVIEEMLSVNRSNAHRRVSSQMEAGQRVILKNQSDNILQGVVNQLSQGEYTTDGEFLGDFGALEDKALYAVRLGDQMTLGTSYASSSDGAAHQAEEANRTIEQGIIGAFNAAMAQGRKREAIAIAEWHMERFKPETQVAVRNLVDTLKEEVLTESSMQEMLQGTEGLKELDAARGALIAQGVPEDLAVQATDDAKRERVSDMNRVDRRFDQSVNSGVDYLFNGTPLTPKQITALGPHYQPLVSSLSSLDQQAMAQSTSTEVLEEMNAWGPEEFEINGVQGFIDKFKHSASRDDLLTHVQRGMDSIVSRARVNLWGAAPGHELTTWEQSVLGERAVDWSARFEGEDIKEFEKNTTRIGHERVAEIRREMELGSEELGDVYGYLRFDTASELLDHLSERGVVQLDETFAGTVLNEYAEAWGGRKEEEDELHRQAIREEILGYKADGSWALIPRPEVDAMTDVFTPEEKLEIMESHVTQRDNHRKILNASRNVPDTIVTEARNFIQGEDDPKEDPLLEDPRKVAQFLYMIRKMEEASLARPGEFQDLDWRTALSNAAADVLKIREVRYSNVEGILGISRRFLDDLEGPWGHPNQEFDYEVNLSARAHGLPLVDEKGEMEAIWTAHQVLQLGLGPEYAQERVRLQAFILSRTGYTEMDRMFLYQDDPGVHMQLDEWGWPGLSSVENIGQIEGSIGIEDAIQEEMGQEAPVAPVSPRRRGRQGTVAPENLPLGLPGTTLEDILDEEVEGTGAEGRRRGRK